MFSDTFDYRVEVPVGGFAVNRLLDVTGLRIRHYTQAAAAGSAAAGNVEYREDLIGVAEFLRRCEVDEAVGRDWVIAEKRPTRGFRTVIPDRENPSLYRVFAALNVADLAAVRQFADAYGLPCGDEGQSGLRLRGELTDRPRGPAIPDRPLGTLASLVFHVRCMRTAIKMHEALQNGDDGELLRWFRWVTNAPAGTSARPEWMVNFPERLDRSYFARMDPAADDDYLDELAGREGEDWVPLLVYGVRADLDHGSASVRAVARDFFDDVVDSKVDQYNRVRFLQDEATGRRTLRVVPPSLIGLMWLQFARAIVGGKTYITCRAGDCGKPIEVLPKHRGRKEFCDARCKMRHYRRQESRAVELAGTGRSVDEIAAELGEDRSKVERWVRKEGGR